MVSQGRKKRKGGEETKKTRKKGINEVRRIESSEKREGESKREEEMEFVKNDGGSHMGRQVMRNDRMLKTLTSLVPFQ